MRDRLRSNRLELHEALKGVSFENSSSRVYRLTRVTYPESRILGCHYQNQRSFLVR